MESFKVFAPTRADLAGGTLDLWPLYCLVGRAVTINIALDLPVVASFETAPGSQFQVEVRSQSGESFSFKEPQTMEQVHSLGLALQFPVAVISHYVSQKPAVPRKSFRVTLSSEVPMGSGLGGSSAMCIALARGLARIFGDYIDQGWQWSMLNWVKDMEAAFLKTPTGTQDYLASLFGGVSCFDYKIGSVERVPYASGVFEGLSQRLLVLFSGEIHQSGMSNWELFKGALSGNASLIQGMREVAQVSEELDAELRAGNLNWRYIGKCLSEEWKVRKELFRVETSRLEEIIEFLDQKHVYGAKVCGAAQGGSLIALVEPEYTAKIAEKCRLSGIQVLPAQASSKGVYIS